MWTLASNVFESSRLKFPWKGANGGAVVIVEAQQAICDFTSGLEVIGREHLALNNGEVHLDLGEPAGVHGCVHRDDHGPTSLQALDASLTAADVNRS